MLLCLDIGNTHIYGGVFEKEKLKQNFRYPSEGQCTSDQFGLFLKAVLRENKLNPDDVDAICLGSVVPTLDYSLIAAAIKYFKVTPLVLQPGVKTGLKIRTKNPVELGSDRIANSVAAAHYYPGKGIIVIDFGTATTTCVLSAEREYLGGTIMPGIKVSMEALHQRAAKLHPVDIVKPNKTLGRTTVENIQSGLFFSQLGGVKEIIERLKEELFSQSAVPVVVATGGYAHLFAEETVIDQIMPDLVLHGLRIIFERNQ